MKLLFNLWAARGLVSVGFLAAYVPVGATSAHIGDENTRLINASTRSWHHLVREGFGDLSTMAAILVILFAAPRLHGCVIVAQDDDEEDDLDDADGDDGDDDDEEGDEDDYGPEESPGWSD